MNMLLKYPKCLLLIAILLVGLAMGVVRQNDLFADFLIYRGGIVILTSLTTLFGIVALAVFLWKRRIGKFLSYGFVVGCASIASLYVFMQTGSLLNRWKVEAVESYVARAVPILDEIKRQKGFYPTNLPINLLGNPPKLLRDDGYYAATPTSFCFVYVDESAGWAGGEGPLQFDNTNRQWMEAGDIPPFQIKN